MGRKKREGKRSRKSLPPLRSSSPPFILFTRRIFERTLLLRSAPFQLHRSPLSVHLRSAEYCWNIPPRIRLRFHYFKIRNTSNLNQQYVRASFGTQQNRHPRDIRGPEDLERVGFRPQDLYTSGAGFAGMTLKGFCKRFVRVCFWFDNTFCLSILNLAKHLVESKRILFANRTIGRSGRQHVIRLCNVGLFCIEVTPIEETHFLIWSTGVV